jgi:predicted acyltransferase
MALYAITIFLSAFLLFQVQPLIAKIILPWFGGSAAVWSASLLFFQLVLLAGYAYAHLSIRYLKARGQMMLHAALLLGSCLILPILPNPSWRPTQAGDPTLRILTVLAVTIGLPYFLLSSTSPLLQAWYVRRSGSGIPYRLFALSNFGSL